MKKIAWSHSALDQFTNCPKQYYHAKIKKDLPFEETEQSRYGKDVHKAFELYVKNGTPLPFGMKQYAPYLDKFKAQPGDKLVEQRMAINQQFQPTGYFDRDVWFRGQADLLIINKAKALVIDYKTGKQKDNWDQLDLMAACTFCLDPEVEEITAAFFWTQTRDITKKKYVRGDVTDIWARFLPRCTELNLAVSTSDFPPKQGWLCRYCGVKTCAYKE